MLRTISPLLVAAGIGLGSLAAGGVASADCTTYPAISCVGPVTSPASSLTTQPATADGSSTATATAPAAETAAASSLAFTGADVAGTAAGGAVVILLGAGLVRASRRRKA